eukprot:2506029-Amphidinium_carterae.2
MAVPNPKLSTHLENAFCWLKSLEEHIVFNLSWDGLGDPRTQNGPCIVRKTTVPRGWEELVSKNKEGKDGVPHVFAEGRKILEAGKYDGAKGGSCKSKVQVAVEIERKFMVATMGDMKKKKAELDRIPARALKFLPQVTLPNPETGDDELYYCFADPDCKASILKQCTVKVSIVNEREIDGLRPEAFVSQEHCEGFLKAAVVHSGGENGVGNMLSKEGYMSSFDEWYNSKFEKGSEDTPASVLWSGLKPEETSLSDLSKSTSVQRQSTQEGIGSQSAPNRLELIANASDAGGDDVSMTSAGATGHGVAQGWHLFSLSSKGSLEDSFQYYKQEIKLEWCADNTQDYRSVVGLKRAIDRLEKKPDKAAERLLMTQFKSQIEKANKLHERELKHLSDAELTDILDMLKQNEAVLSDKTKLQLLDRKKERLLAEGSFREAIDILFPFCVEPFGMHHPKIAGMSLPIAEKVEKFQDVLFNKTIVPMVLDASNKRDMLKSIVAHCINLLDSVLIGWPSLGSGT